MFKLFIINVPSFNPIVNGLFSSLNNGVGAVTTLKFSTTNNKGVIMLSLRLKGSRFAGSFNLN